jgi:hypothetical protein
MKKFADAAGGVLFSLPAAVPVAPTAYFTLLWPFCSYELYSDNRTMAFASSKCFWFVDIGQTRNEASITVRIKEKTMVSPTIAGSLAVASV